MSEPRDIDGIDEPSRSTGTTLPPIAHRSHFPTYLALAFAAAALAAFLAATWFGVSR